MVIHVARQTQGWISAETRRQYVLLCVAISQEQWRCANSERESGLGVSGSTLDTRLAIKPK